MGGNNRGKRGNRGNDRSDGRGDNKITPMLTVKEVARLLHVHSNTVRRMSDNGLIQTYRISPRGDRRFKREDIADFLATQLAQR